MPILIAALREVGVPVKVIADIDVLREVDLLERFVKVLGGDWAVIGPMHGKVKTSVEAKKGWFKAGDLRSAIDGFLEHISAEAVVDSATIKKIKDSCRQTSPWAEVKGNGLPGPLKGQAANEAADLLTELATLGLYVVPVGEMECFDKLSGGHGAAWVQEVLTKRDLKNDAALHSAREFMTKVYGAFVI